MLIRGMQKRRTLPAAYVSFLFMRRPCVWRLTAIPTTGDVPTAFLAALLDGVAVDLLHSFSNVRSRRNGPAYGGVSYSCIAAISSH